MKNKKVFFIGGTGTLSNGVLKEALSNDWDITILTRGLSTKAVPDGIHKFVGDFKNIESLKVLLQNCYFDVIVDFLSRTPKDISRVFPILQNKCKQYIFISSACVYRRDVDDFPVKETSPKPNRDWNYNIEKFNSEKELIKLSKNSQCYYTIIRPYITYDDERIPFGITPVYKYHRTIIERLRNGKPMFVWNEGNNITTLTYVTDFAKGVVGLFLNSAAINEDFHITSDYQYNWIEFWNILIAKLKSKSVIYNIDDEDIKNYMPYEKNLLKGDRALDAIFDNTKIKAAVPNLSFGIDLYKGIDNILDNYKCLMSWNYDYRYDAIVDKMLAERSKKCKYIKYKNAKKSSYLIYYIYRYIPFVIAERICRILKIKL